MNAIIECDTRIQTLTMPNDSVEGLDIFLSDSARMFTKDQNDILGFIEKYLYYVPYITDPVLAQQELLKGRIQQLLDWDINKFTEIGRDSTTVEHYKGEAYVYTRDFQTSLPQYESTDPYFFLSKIPLDKNTRINNLLGTSSSNRMEYWNVPVVDQRDGRAVIGTLGYAFDSNGNFGKYQRIFGNPLTYPISKAINIYISNHIPFISAGRSEEVTDIQPLEMSYPYDFELIGHILNVLLNKTVRNKTLPKF